MTYKEQIRHPKWQKKRLEIMQRDDFKCQYCKSENKTLNVHHLCYISGLKIWEYDNELLITLCEKHHGLIEDIKKVMVLIAKDFIFNKVDLIQ